MLAGAQDVVGVLGDLGRVAGGMQAQQLREADHRVQRRCISWLMRERNWLLARLASSAACLSSSACSACSIGVMSVCVPTTRRAAVGAALDDLAAVEHADPAAVAVAAGDASVW